MRFQLFFVPDNADRPMASNFLHQGPLLVCLVLVEIDRLSQQRCFLGAHAAPDYAEQRLGQVVVPALVGEPLCHEHERGPQCFQLGPCGLFVDGIDALETGKHERYDDEEVHGLVAVSQIVEPDEGLEVLVGIGHDMVRGRFLVRHHIEKGFIERENKMMVIDAAVEMRWLAKRG